MGFANNFRLLCGIAACTLVSLFGIPANSTGNKSALRHAFFHGEPLADGIIKINPYAYGVSDPNDIERLSSGRQHYRPFRPVDWSVLAHAHAELNVDQPGPADIEIIKKSYWEICRCSNVTYQAPWDSDFVKGNFYLISPNGVSDIIPTGFLGTVRYGMNREQTQVILPPDYFGSLEGRVKDTKLWTDHGLVLFAETPQAFTKTSPKELPSRFATAIDSFVFTLSPSGISYLFVQWPPDTQCQEGCCEIRYGVFPIEGGAPAEKPAAGLSAKCDV
jgi:hypothetical protein